MGYVSTENEQNSNAGVKRISYREALANGMWRVRTAPLVFYVGDSAYHMDPILSQGAGLGIEGAYRLAKTLQDSKFSQKLLQNKEENKGFDFDDLMPDLMECENQRYSVTSPLCFIVHYADSAVDISVIYDSKG